MVSWLDPHHSPWLQWFIHLSCKYIFASFIIIPVLCHHCIYHRTIICDQCHLPRCKCKPVTLNLTIHAAKPLHILYIDTFIAERQIFSRYSDASTASAALRNIFNTTHPGGISIHSSWVTVELANTIDRAAAVMKEIGCLSRSFRASIHPPLSSVNSDNLLYKIKARQYNTSHIYHARPP
jgi:hypothetical protein